MPVCLQRTTVNKVIIRRSPWEPAMSRHRQRALPFLAADCEAKMRILNQQINSIPEIQQKEKYWHYCLGMNKNKIYEDQELSSKLVLLSLPTQHLFVVFHATHGRNKTYTLASGRPTEWLAWEWREWSSATTCNLNALRWWRLQTMAHITHDKWERMTLGQNGSAFLSCGRERRGLTPGLQQGWSFMPATRRVSGEGGR